MTLEIRSLSPHLGVEVLNIDVNSLNANHVHEIGELWRRHLVIVFKGQELSDAEQRAFAARFGPVMEMPNAAASPDPAAKYSLIIGNQAVDGREGILPDGEMWFHFDLAYVPMPAAAGILYAIEVPPTGGNTLFSNAAAAYAELDGELRQQANSLKAVNVYDYATTAGVVDADNPNVLSHVHPVIVAHPVTGQPAIFVSRLMTSRIIDVDASQSADILTRLFASVENPRYVYEHIWSPGDLVMWDNTCVLHARTWFPPTERRVLRRVSLERSAVPVPPLVSS